MLRSTSLLKAMAALRADDRAAYETALAGMKRSAAAGGELVPAYRDVAIPVAEAMAARESDPGRAAELQEGYPLFFVYISGACDRLGRHGEAIEAAWDLSGDEPFFADHFPGAPLVPAVLLGEALAQTCGLSIFGQQPGQRAAANRSTRIALGSRSCGPGSAALRARTRTRGCATSCRPMTSASPQTTTR